MSVKFIRTCDRCGKVIEEKNGYVVAGKEPVKSNAKYGVISAESHPIFSLKNFHLCPDCCEDFESFMQGQLVCDISLRGKYVDTDNAKTIANEKFGKPKTTIYEKKEEQDGWSPKVLELARKHNESCEKPKPAVSTSVDKSKIQLKPGTHTYHRWSKEEDQFILYHSAGMTMNELANKFGVTLKAVQLRKSMILNGKVHVEKEDLK